MSDQQNFADAGRATIVALNGGVLLSCTIVGATLSAYADLFQGLAPSVAGLVALIGWGASLMLVLYLAGRDVGAMGAAGRIRFGLRLAMDRRNWRFTLVLLLLTAGTAFTTWSRVSKDQGSVLQRLLFATLEVRERTESIDHKSTAILSDTAAIRAVVTRDVAPIEALARMGFTASDEDGCRLALTGQVDAMRLYGQAHPEPLSFARREGPEHSTFCLEELLLGKSGAQSLANVFEHIRPSREALSRMYASQTLGGESKERIAFSSLLQDAGVKQADQSQLLEVHASPLLYAVWGARVNDVDTLLAQGADPNLGGKLVVTEKRNQMNEVVVIHTTPLAEANRLGQRAIAERLQRLNAKAKTSKTANLN